MMEFLRVFCVILLLGLAVSTPNPGCPTLSVKPCRCREGVAGTNLECDRVTSTADLRQVFVNSKGTKYNSVVINKPVLNYIPREIFEGVEVKMLRVFNGTLVSLFNELTGNVPSLTFLGIEHTHIYRGVEWKQLQTMTNLRHLKMRHVNKIEVLGEDFVKYAPKSLEQIRLYGTKTTKIIEGAFDNFPNLGKVTIDHCPLKELKRNMFPVPFNVQYLAFRDNQLTSLPVDMFSDMPNLKSVGLSGNSLTTIPPYDSEKLQSIGLEGNPLNCDCDLAWIVEKKEFRGTCSTPEELKGRDLKDVYKNMRCL